ncbi:MAG: GNAT family N-acetyltransferase [Bacteroidetes bacterium]|nr:GNAT family N-acetyltransferase [Bacteroidota bacterium]
MDKQEFEFRKATIKDNDAIFKLYKQVSKRSGGLARSNDEVSKKYVEQFILKSLNKGVEFVVIDKFQENRIIGEIHCYKLDPKVFNHVFSELTIAIDPDYQGKGLGKKLFETLLNYIVASRRDILRVELIAAESNIRAIKMYESLGFIIEGRFERRITSPDNKLEADIPMAWFNPKYSR